jgi:hypothetical protein
MKIKIYRKYIMDIENLKKELDQYVLKRDDLWRNKEHSNEWYDRFNNYTEQINRITKLMLNEYQDKNPKKVKFQEQEQEQEQLERDIKKYINDIEKGTHNIINQCNKDIHERITKTNSNIDLIKDDLYITNEKINIMDIMFKQLMDFKLKQETINDYGRPHAVCCMCAKLHDNKNIQL